MDYDVLDAAFSEDGIFFEDAAPHTQRLYTVLDAQGNLVAENVSAYDRRGAAAFYDMFGAAGPYQYIESYTKLADGRVLFSDENAPAFSHDASHVSSHVELHVHGKRVYDNILADDAHDLISLWTSEESVVAEYESYLASLADALPVINAMVEMYPPMIDTVIKNLLRPFPTPRSLVGNPFVVYIHDAVNDASAPTTNRASVDKFGMRKVAKLPTKASKEYRYAGVPESVLEAHGFTLLDVATLRPVMNGTQQTIRDFLATNKEFAPMIIREGRVVENGNVLIVKYTNVWKYVQRMYRDGYTVYIRGTRRFSGTKQDCATYINRVMKNDKHITRNDVRAVRIANNPLPVVAYTMR